MQKKGLESEKTKTARKYAPQTLYTTYGCRNLRFLLDILVATGHTPQSLGRFAENPASFSSSMRQQLNEDDMRISKIKRIVNMLGYTISFKLKDRLVNDELPNYKLILPEKLRQNLEHGFLKETLRNKNLSFLYEFMSRNAISQRQLARDLKKTSGCVSTWFNSDDVAVSYLFGIAEKYDADLCITISEVNSKNDSIEETK